jgi:CRISPR/Cas system CSM-associated protein Csm5 (group 7 of RAMP superfamily)
MNLLTKILGQIGKELNNQISLAKNIDEKIDARKLVEQSKALNDILRTSEITQENKSMLQKFSLTLQEG